MHLNIFMFFAIILLLLLCYLLDESTLVSMKPAMETEEMCAVLPFRDGVG